MVYLVIAGVILVVAGICCRRYVDKIVKEQNEKSK